MGNRKQQKRKKQVKKHRYLFVVGTLLVFVGAAYDFHMLVEGLVLIGSGMLTEAFI